MKQRYPRAANRLEHVRAYVKTFAGWNIDRVTFHLLGGEVPASELAIHMRIAGRRALAGAFAYTTIDKNSLDPALNAYKPHMRLSYAFICADDGSCYHGLAAEITAFDDRDRCARPPRLHQPFEDADGNYYITATGFARTPQEFKAGTPDAPRILVDAGDRGTILTPITIVPDGTRFSDLLNRPA